MKVLLLLVVFACRTAHAAPLLCTRGGMAVAVRNSSSCPAGSQPFAAAGVNIYDLMWDAQCVKRDREASQGKE